MRRGAAPQRAVGRDTARRKRGSTEAGSATARSHAWRRAALQPFGRQGSRGASSIARIAEAHSPLLDLNVYDLDLNDLIRNRLKARIAPMGSAAGEPQRPRATRENEPEQHQQHHRDNAASSRPGEHIQLCRARATTNSRTTPPISSSSRPAWRLEAAGQVAAGQQFHGKRRRTGMVFGR